MKHIFFLLSFLALFSISISCQTVCRSIVASAGDHFKTESVSVFWTLGEVAIQTFSTDGISLSQGFHQGNLKVNAIVDMPDFQLKAYPNPVLNKLIIETFNPKQRFEVVDANGKVIKNGIITSDQYELDCSNLPAGLYFLRVNQQHTHKIIKQ